MFVDAERAALEAARSNRLATLEGGNQPPEMLLAWLLPLAQGEEAGLLQERYGGDDPQGAARVYADWLADHGFDEAAIAQRLAAEGFAWRVASWFLILERGRMLYGVIARSAWAAGYRMWAVDPASGSVATGADAQAQPLVDAAHQGAWGLRDRNWTPPPEFETAVRFAMAKELFSSVPDLWRWFRGKGSPA